VSADIAVLRLERSCGEEEMPEGDPELERLLAAERKACERYDRMSGPLLPLVDKETLKAARELCEEARRAVERYRAQAPDNRF
jgi:hypothetical protein